MAVVAPPAAIALDNKGTSRQHWDFIEGDFSRIREAVWEVARQFQEHQDSARVCSVGRLAGQPLVGAGWLQIFQACCRKWFVIIMLASRDQGSREISWQGWMYTCNAHCHAHFIKHAQIVVANHYAANMT